jgi:hypothetical protein
MPRTSFILPADRRRERDQLLKDPLVRRLLRDLIVGPSDPVLQLVATNAARLIQVGFSLLELVAESAVAPPSQDLASPRGLRRARRGDRLCKDDCIAWTDLADGAAVQAELILASPDTREVRQWIRRLTPTGLRAAATENAMLLLGDLTPQERTELARSVSREPRTPRRARLKPERLRRYAKALRAVAQLLEK